MGGGSEFEWMDVEDLEALAAYVFQVCDTVAYGISLTSEKEELEKEYSELDTLLASLGETLPFVVAKTAAHVTAVQRMRQLAARYKDLEVSTYGTLEGARRLAEGFLGLLLIPSPFPPTAGTPGKAVMEALRRKSPSMQQALKLGVQRMQHVAQLLMATSAAHRAVSRDMDLVVSGAADIVDDPLKCDIGLKAAPVIGATAGGSLGLLLLRGALGPVAAIGLATLGALGAQELTQQNIVPQVRAAFQRMYDEASQVSSLIDSKASSLGVIAGDLMAASILLQQLVDLSLHPGPLSAGPLETPGEELHQALSKLLLRCDGCRQRLSAFRALTYTLAPQTNAPLWAKWRSSLAEIQLAESKKA